MDNQIENKVLDYKNKEDMNRNEFITKGEAFLRAFANLVATYGEEQFIKHAKFHIKELQAKKVG